MPPPPPPWPLPPQIIQVNLTTDGPVLVAPNATLTFKYSVAWQPTRTPFTRRFERYLDYTFFEHKVGTGPQGRSWHTISPRRPLLLCEDPYLCA